MLSDLLQVLADALGGGTPFADHALHARLSAEERLWLERVDPDAFAVTRLVVRKLRLERVLLGDRELRAACEHDPERFAAAFRAFERACPDAASFPEEEASAFRAFLRGARPAP